MKIKATLKLVTLFIFFVYCKQTNEQLLNKAFELSKNKQYEKSIEVYSKVIKSNSKLQIAYYNRGFAYVALKQYEKALRDFNKVMALQTQDNLIVTYNPTLPFADEEALAQIPYNDALYHRAQVKYFMDSLKSSFIDFETLVYNNYVEKSNCILWQGTIYVRSGMSDKACEYFRKSKQFALTVDDQNEADKMLNTYCK